MHDDVGKAQLIWELIQVWRSRFVGAVIGMPIISLGALLYGAFTGNLDTFSMGLLGLAFSCILLIPFVRHATRIRSERLDEYYSILDEVFSMPDNTKEYFLFEPPRNWERITKDELIKRLRYPFIIGYKAKTKFIEEKGNMLIKCWGYKEPEWDGLWYVS